MLKLALLAASSMLAISPASICSMAAEGEDGAGGGGTAPAKSTMTKSEIDTMLDGTVDAVLPKLASLTPATRAKVAAAEKTRGDRVMILAAIERLGDTPAEKPETPDAEGDQQQSEGGDDDQQQSEDAGKATSGGPGTTPVEAPGSGPDNIPATDANRVAASTFSGEAAPGAPLVNTSTDAPGDAPDVVRDVRIEGDDREITPEYVADLEKRLRDASASEPIEKIRGLVLEAGAPFGVTVKDGEEAADLVKRFLVAADEMRVDLGARAQNALDDLRDTQSKLANARKRNDPGALARGRGTAKARKVGADFEALVGDDGQQSPLDKILLGDDPLELVFSNGVNELVEFAPFEVRGTSFNRVGGGWMLREGITLKGSGDDTRIRGAALLLDGKQIAWAAFIEPVRVPRNQEVNFDKMILFK